MNIEKSILIAGGYGVVGQQVAKVIRQKHPSIPLLLGGRNPQKGESIAKELGNTDTIKIDLTNPNPIKGLKPHVILGTVNDPHDYLLIYAVDNGIPYIDITRWTDRMRAVEILLSKKILSAPIILASSWMAGVASIIAYSLSMQLNQTDQIDISILYSLKDKAGPNSIEYMDRLSSPFDVMEKGKLKRVYPYTSPRKITFPGGYSGKVYRIDTPDQYILPITTDAKTVSTRITFDDLFSTKLLVILAGTGLWKLISGERFKTFRKKILFNPGKGANHEIIIEVSGKDNNTSKTLLGSIVDPEGQTHLTALGALIQLERILGLDGGGPPHNTIIYPDTEPQIDSALNLLRSFGVELSI